MRDGDTIRAVIRNTGINHDGSTQGITMPSKAAQMALIRSVYEKAGIEPNDTAYIEAHGTGTMVGDVEEIGAIRSIFEERRSGLPIHVGSVKPNIGHLESASGLAGFIKAVLMIENGKIPPNLNLENFKKDLRLEESAITVCLLVRKKSVRPN